MINKIVEYLSIEALLIPYKERQRWGVFWLSNFSMEPILPTLLQLVGMMSDTVRGMTFQGILSHLNILQMAHLMSTSSLNSTGNRSLIW